MFDLLDTALRSVLSAGLPAGTRVTFASPNDALPEHGTAAVNAWLHQVSEDPQGRVGAWLDRRDASGRIVAREKAPRIYRVGYYVTAMADDVDVEHSLLGAALAALSAHDTLAPPHLPSPMADAGLPVSLAVADPALPRLSPETWSALGVPPRSGFDVVLTAPLLPLAPPELASPPSKLSLGVSSSPRQPVRSTSARGSLSSELREE